MVSMVGPSYQAEEGVCIPQYADIEKNLKRLSEFQPRNTDYIFCSYPKSGKLLQIKEKTKCILVTLMHLSLSLV